MLRKAAVFLSLLLLGAAAVAADVPAEVDKTLKTIAPGETPDSVRAAPVPGLYEVSFGSDIFYISSDGRFVLQGDLYDLSAQTNLTERQRARFRVGLMQSVNAKDAIIFAPPGKPRYTVYVFTDVDCTYCRKLHSQIDEYTKRGIEIRYLAYPRSGIDTPSYYKAVSVWCSSDRKRAITAAKAGQAVERKTCDNPVEREMSLGNQIGVTGTPTLVFSDGSVLPGYASPDQLIEYLDAHFGS